MKVEREREREKEKETRRDVRSEGVRDAGNVFEECE